MPYSEAEQVSIGSRFSTQRLLEQGAVSVAMARAHAKELEKMFPAARVDELEGLLGEIRTKFEGQAGAKSAYAQGNVPVEVCLRDAKRWIGDVIAAADNAFEEEGDLCDEFHKGGKIGRSVPKTAGRLQVLLTLAEAHKAALAPWGVDDADLAEGRTLLDALTAANTAQEAAVKDLPATTQELHVLKAKAYLLMKRLARASRRTFKDDAAVAAKMNLDILQRHGHRRAEEAEEGEEAEEPAPAPEAAPAPAP